MGDPPRHHRPSTSSYQSPTETPLTSSSYVRQRTSSSAGYPSYAQAQGDTIPLGHSYPPSTLAQEQEQQQSFLNSTMHHSLQQQQHDYQDQHELFLTSQFGGSLAVTPEDAGSEASSTHHGDRNTMLTTTNPPASQHQSNNNSAMVSSSSFVSGGDVGSGGLTRHVTAVMTHFTNSKVALSRLLGELDDCLFILSVSGTLIWTSPSTQKALGESNVSGTLQKPFLLLVHENDRRAFLSHIADTLSAPGSAERTTHLRIFCGTYSRNTSIDQCPSTAVWEIRSRKASDPGSRVILCAAREYQSKASLALDSVLDLRVENYKLRKTFVDLLEKKGMDPGTHPLLQDPRKDPGLAKGLFPPALQITPGSVLTQSSLSATSHSSTSNAFGQPLSSSGRTPQTATLSSTGSYLPPSATAGSATSHPVDNTGPSAVKAAGGARQLPSIVCRHCGTQESPEWRKGPDGPRT